MTEAEHFVSELDRRYGERVRTFLQERLGWASAEEVGHIWNRVLWTAWKRQATACDFDSDVHIWRWVASCVAQVVRSVRSNRRGLTLRSGMSDAWWLWRRAKPSGREPDGEGADGVVAALVSMLPAAEAEALRACVLSDESVKAAARRVGVQPGTMRARRDRALERVRVHLAKCGAAVVAPPGPKA